MAPLTDTASFGQALYAPLNGPGTGSALLSDGELLAEMYGSSGDTGYGLATFNLSHATGIKGADGVLYGHLGATYGYQSIVGYSPVLNLTFAVASNIETDYQAQPSDTLCSIFNGVRNALHGKPPPMCNYTVSYYNGGCKCTGV